MWIANTRARHRIYQLDRGLVQLLRLAVQSKIGNYERLAGRNRILYRLGYYLSQRLLVHDKNRLFLYANSRHVFAPRDVAKRQEHVHVGASPADLMQTY